MASFQGLIKRAIQAGPEGTMQFVRGLERAMTPREFTDEKEVSVPNWVKDSESGRVLRTKGQSPFVSFSIQSYGSGRINHFVTASGDSQTLNLTPDEEFRTLDLTVLDTKHTDHLRVEATFTTKSGDEIVQNRELTAGDFFSARFVPIRFTIDEPAHRVSVELHSQTSTPDMRERLFRLYHRSDWKESSEPCLSVPTPRAADGTPILLISVDTFRYDYLHTFDEVINELGENIVIPNEPRTQGYCTQPSHGSLFTGVHPTRHGNFAKKPTDNGLSGGIDDDLTTITELLNRNQYKCSGCGSEEKIGPTNGFGDGMDRFRHYPISWDDRVYDGADIANAVTEWIRTDASAPSNRLFYFLHFFDPHYPYIPPQPEQIDNGLNYQLADQVRERAPQTAYLDVVNNDSVDLETEQIEILKQNYEASLEYTASQIRRVIKQLKISGLFEESLVIITGDHGEEFFERKFWGHSSLYDANIRPGMIIKLPNSSEINVRDQVDLIDIFPTIAQLVEGKTPEACQGIPLQEDRSGPRITERHGSEHYNVAVESGGAKGIFTYEYQFPGCPTQRQLDSGPTQEEFYRLSAVRTGDYDDSGQSISERERTQLRSLAKAFISDREQTTYEMSGSVPRDVEDRLEQLGYK